MPGISPDAEGRVIGAWEAKGESAGDALEQAAFRALARVASALLVRHGLVWGGRDMIASLATGSKRATSPMPARARWGAS